MDETTYADPKVAELIKSEFVAIKVDNDQRPDINSRYNMGGWPSTVWLTPSGDILAGATYLTAEQMLESLRKVLSYWRTHQTEIASAALEARKRSGRRTVASVGRLGDGLVEEILGLVRAAYDAEFGGFGSEMKFPHAEAIVFLLEQAQIKAEVEWAAMALHSLEAMVGGELYDKLEGGFFRYATKRNWSEPHYEKMLEDQAGLVSALARARMSEMLSKTVRYLEMVLRRPNSKLYGGSQDANQAYYALDASGRRGAGAPTVDMRVYTNWNAQMAVAYLEAAAYSGNEAWRERAREMLEELLATKYKVGVGWEHTEGVEGQLADQAWGLWASLKAYQGGLGEQWWTAAQAMVTQIEGHYADGEHGGYFDIAHEGVGRLRERMKPLGENALMAMALREMDVLSDGEGGYRVRARRILESVAGVVAQSGVMASGFARALDRLESDLKVTTGNWELAAAAIRAHPYVVIDPRGDERALICVGKTCLSPVTSAAEVTKAVREATNKPKIAGQVVSIA